jgi:hydroxymethylpyrimidine/phosphomethylpyrimidine kinase
MRRWQGQPVALTIAGSDSGGGAGIQADLKTFHALGVFGTSAITCVTAQNPDRVSAIQAIRPGIVAEQIARVCEAFPVGAVKTGMLYDAGIITAVAAELRAQKISNLVVDPVMVATSGALLLKPGAIRALTAELFPLARLVTPNLAELEVLVNDRVRTLPELRAAARELNRRYAVAVLAKGGHLPVGGVVVDVLCEGERVREFRSAHVAAAKPHGAGCTFSAAIAAFLARGFSLEAAAAGAKRFIGRAIREPIRWGRRRALRV